MSKFLQIQKLFSITLSLEQLLRTVGQNNFGNIITFLFLVIRQVSGSHQAGLWLGGRRFKQSLDSHQTILAQPCRLKGFLFQFRSRIKKVKQVLNLIEIIVVVSTNIFQARGKFPSNKMNPYTSRTGLLHTSKIQMNTRCFCGQYIQHTCVVTSLLFNLKC